MPSTTEDPTVLINKEGQEFARIIGEINFQNIKFLKWLSKHDQL